MTGTNKRNEELEFDDSKIVKDNGQVILGHLKGPCADFINSTRNGRKYDESLWEKVFSDPIVNEYFQCGGIPGELDHPADRTETCSEKIAIMLPEKPKKNDKGELVATFDILDTPNGRITYTLAKYGYKLGISSRGSGDTYMDVDGKEHVDEDSYDFVAFDVVLLPAVKSARMEFTESLDTSNKNNKTLEDTTFKNAMCEAISKSNDNEKKIMEETLKNLKIDYLPKKVDNICNSTSLSEACNMGSIDDSIHELQETLKVNAMLEKTVTELKNKLSVCYAKDEENLEKLETYKSNICKLTESVKTTKALQNKVSKLEECLDNKTKELVKAQKLVEEMNKSIATNRQMLNESYGKDKAHIKELTMKVNSLSESLTASQYRCKEIEEKSNIEKESLIEKYATSNKDSEIKLEELNNRLSKQKTMVEKYKSIASKAINKYIDNQAVILGVKPDDIKNRLSENFSFDEIDNVCECLQSYQVNMSKLPIGKNSLTENVSNARVKVTNQVESIIPARFDDNIDESLMSLAGL